MNLQNIPRRPNYLINGGFEFAQRVNTGIPDSSTEYTYDRWYVVNSLGTNGLIEAGTPPLSPQGINGPLLGLRLGAFPAGFFRIATAPTALQANGLTVYHTLEQRDSMVFYNNLATFAIWAQQYDTNTTQIGITLMYKTTEAKVDTALSSEYTFDISSGNWTRCVIQGVPVGTTLTTAGVIGVRIRPTAGTGNLYDLNVGFLLAQGMLVPGAVVPKTFQRAGLTRGGELALCRRFFRKSYNVDVAPGTANSPGCVYLYKETSGVDGGGNHRFYGPLVFDPPMRTTPTITYYSQAGTSGQMTYDRAGNGGTTGYYNEFVATSADGLGITTADLGISGGIIDAYSSASSALNFGVVHYTADAEI